MLVEMNVVLKKEMMEQTDTFTTVDEITLEFNTLFNESRVEIHHFDTCRTEPVFANNSLLLKNIFGNENIESVLLKDLVNNRFFNDRDTNISFITRKNIPIKRGYQIDIILKSDDFSCLAATQGFVFSGYFVKSITSIINIDEDKDLITSVDVAQINHYINSDIEDATSNGYTFNYDGIIIYNVKSKLNTPLSDLGIKSLKGECVTRSTKRSNENDYTDRYIIFNRREMVKSIFRR